MSIASVRMAARGSEEDDFGISVPPLVEYLRGILREYSDGQIIKELVQNAEDAGADTVKFLYDVQQHGTDTLYKPTLAPYQGPALYSFNNAKFKDVDWDGIQNIARSNKKTNRLKVGRFGIGFNSVYHITDLPSIMSDQTLAFIDPLEEHFFDQRGRVKTGKRFVLSSNSETFSTCQDQFSPYDNIFPGVTGGISTGHYDGTLFRFPLRLTANELSDKTYNDENRMDELLQAFQVDADVVMLFLRSLNNVEVLKRHSGQQEPSLVVRVRREHDQDGNPQERDFSSRLESYCSDESGSRRPIEMTDCVTYTTETQETSKTHRWIVSHLIAGDSISGELSILAEKQSHLPWAAIAIPISSSEPYHAVDEAESLGRVFCFLPLPPGEESLTGLPVHVHGFFGVNSDRRGIKWPGPDQTDTPAQWNKLLVSELIPIAYVNAIRYAISLHMSQQNVSTDSIYQSWPDHEVVRGNWDVLLEPFYTALFKEVVIHSDNKGWMKVADVFFNELAVQKEMEEAILKCFSMSGIAYAKVPPNCRQAIERFYQPQVSKISVSSLCRYLREDHSILTKLNREEKLLILEFILQEDAGEDLEGLPLLPLDDCSFEVFSSSERKVYIPTSKFCRKLVPGGHQQFIISEEHSLHQLLSVMGGRYQLKSLTIDAVAELLRATMETWVDDQGSWLLQDISLPTWLEEVWSMLYRESSSKLHLFEGIYLVPLFEAGDDDRRLLQLCPRSRVIQRRHQTSEGPVTLPNGLENVLQQIGVMVTNCPDYVLCHPAIRDEYIKMPTPEGVVTCLLLSDVELLIQKFLSFSSLDRDVLVECLAQAKLSPDGKSLLRHLPLFERVAGTGSSTRTLVCINECREYIECCQTDIPAPLKLTGLLIDGRAKSKSLLQKLEAIQLSKYQVILNVLKEIREGQLYTIPEKQLVLQWIMERWGDISINCKSSVDILRHMKFIHNKDASVLSPSELLDPLDPLLQRLFESHGVFPVAPFDSSQVVAALKQLGMRGQSEVTPAELVKCIEQIEESKSQEKARSLLHLLTKNQGLLQSSVAECMKQKQCIPCKLSPPEYYPSAMEWFGNSPVLLSTPREIMRETKKDVLICGASKRFTSKEDESRFSAVYQNIGMTSSSPTLLDVIAQFTHCVRYAEDRTGEDITDIVPMLKEIYSFLREAWRSDSNVKDVLMNQAKFCIWNGSGFSEPSKMCTGKLPFDLSPYMASIPPAISEFTDLFEALGVEKNMETNADALVQILHEVKRRCDDSEADTAFLQRQRQLVMQILHHIHAVGDLAEEARGQLLVPSHRGECRLIPVEQSAYVDRDWLRQSSENEEMDDGEDFTLIHSDISMDLAKFLHVRPVSRLLLDSEELEGFIQAGQHEPLTMRLWNILKNNYEDTAIVNEMIQNAEDAGAEEVRFLIDLRKNENASKKLFNPGMISCQGPALWVYNDAVFTDQDFENILHLGGRTKEKNTEKIGKFGTGFNSVYRITDVPSFVSREYVQFFDPHTTHLGNVLPNKSQPGVRLKLNSMKQLRRFPDQFKPFNGVFGLDFSRGNTSFQYPGTLFRLPLRSKEAAQKSQICKESYDGEKLISLMRQMWESSQDLLVFTKKVKKISLFYLNENSIDPSAAQELFIIQKDIQPSRKREDDTFISTESYQRRVTAKGVEVLLQVREIGNLERTATFDTLKVVCKKSKQALAVAQSEEGKLHGLSPEGAVAIPLNKAGPQTVKAKIYCGLPLSVFSYLPIHIDGRFAINEDRRSLHSPTPHGMTISERWNHVVFSDVICRAYLSLLSDREFIRQIKKTYGRDISPESFWPDVDEVSENSECSALFDAFYRAIVNGLDGKEPAVFWRDDTPLQFHNVVFLGRDLQKKKEIKDDCMKVLRTYMKEHCCTSTEVIELSEKTWQAFERVGVTGKVEMRTYTLNRFFDDVFLPYLEQVPRDLKDRLLLFVINATEGNLNQKLKDVKCIPVAGESELKRPRELMHSDDQILRELFELQGVFPTAPFDSGHLIPAFKRLGMRGQNEVTPDEIATCVDLIETSPCPTKARVLLQLLNKNPGHFQRTLPNGCTVADFMRKKRCIPCRKSPPEYYPLDLEWHGRTSSCLATPQEILIETRPAALISGTSKSFISQQDHPFSTALTELGITCNTPVLPDLIAQLESCVRYATDRMEQDVTDITSMLKEIYRFLREAWKRDSAVSSHILDRVPFCVWNGNGFSEPSKMCTGKLPFDLAPYMSSIPHATSAFKDMFEGLGVKTNIDTNPDALVEILHDVKRRCDVPGTNVAFQQRQRQLALQVLHHIHVVGKLTEEARRRLLVPAHRGACRLIPVEQSAYVDRDWLRQSSENEEMDDGEDFTLIHSDISMDLAIFLHVRPVSRLLLDSEELQGFTQAGQHEPLTMRLWNILKNNYEDTAIVNEMIQNAEDAGAEEVRFLIDLRKNENASKKLFNPGMISCQGPALWVYNDAVFTDQDFENILHLGGRTKEKNTEKIGKFGTGFNSVYRITDVPSFVSREYVQFFDPHTTHLGNVLPNKSQPGVRLKLNSMKQLRRFPDQFKPFNGVFGLDFSRGNTSFQYPGTLFRLPLRSKEAAQKSQICKESYDGEKLISLMRQMWESSQDLLVFTKKVKKVSLFYLNENSIDPSAAQELFIIQKDIQPSRKREDDTFISTESYQRRVTAKGVEVLLQVREIGNLERTATFDTLKVVCKKSKQALAVAQSEEGKLHGLSPEGAVAIPLNKAGPQTVKAKIYCGLPLSVFSYLPIHIDGRFAINEDRRSLHSPTPHGMTISERWNHVVFSDVICRAYLSLLSDREFIRQIKKTYGRDISPESFWPDVDEVSENSECSALFDAFYRAIVNGLDGKEPAVFWRDDTPLQFHNVVFLGRDLQKKKEIKDDCMKVLRTYMKEHCCTSTEVIELSEKTWQAFERVGVTGKVEMRTYTLNRFFDDVFLPYLEQVPRDLKDRLLLFVINATEGNLNQKLKDVKCIPVAGESELKRPRELMHSDDQILRELFELQGVFPTAPFDSGHLIPAFKRLGMRGQNEVTPDEIATCVDLIETSPCPTKARVLLQLLNKNPGHFQRTLPNGCTVADFMRKKRCIPCRKSPPEYYPLDLEWHGRTSSCLATPQEILIETRPAALISGTSKSFISQQDHPFSTALTELGITCNTPVLPDVIAQLESCVRYATDRMEQDVTDITSMLKEIYRFLREAWKRDSAVSSHILDRVPFCVWNGNGFSEPSKMCTGKLPFDLAPYMSSIPHATSAFKDMFEGLGVKTNIDTNPDALVEILHDVKRRCDVPGTNVAFQQRQRQLALQVLHHIHVVGKLTEEARRRLLVPAHRGECRLIPVEQSAYVDRDWLRQSSENEEMDDGEDFTLIHSDISMDLAIFLHVRPVSRLLLDSEELQGFAQAGQHEPLTMRLWNILKNNYEDTAIVNEMIQNAEDAGAEEVRFLIDLRKNENASKKLFSPGMKSCQGPALWVYNDAVFTDQDFENILRLGGRTKEKNTEKIGKFGTGFNSVYRITDVPSFVSREYVQFFDPHTTHLGNVLPNKSQPGVRLKMNSMKQLRRFPDQFKPFSGVFGLDFSRGNESFHYPGTLFRLPLRSKEAAQKSQICKESYDEEKLISLMRQMWESSQDLLVFTRNVKKVSVSYLDHSTHPSEAEELFTIEKKVHPPRVKDDEIVMLTESFRRTITTRGNDLISRTAECDVTGHLDTFKVICKTSTQAASLAQSPEGKECGLSPEGAVAFPLHRPPISAFEKKVYCFLPLSIRSRFPVHINGSFVVKEDRRSLHMPVPDGRFIHEKWNHILLADVISRAYVSLLSDNEFIQELKRKYVCDVSPESLWPDIDDVPKNSEWSALFDAFYKAMIHGLDGHLPSLFWKDDRSHQFTHVVFLGEDVQEEKSVCDVVTEVLQDHLESLEVISLSEKTWKALERVGLRNEVFARTYDFNRFFDEVFLPKISEVPEDMRNQLVLFALSSRELKGKLKDVDCIPVAGGSELRKPGDLVHPKGEAAPLFSESDKVFPLGEEFNSANTLSSLCELGMTIDSLHELAFLERCETVHILHSKNQEMARKRCYAVLRYLSESLLKHRWQKEEDLKERLKTVPFLPVLCEDNQDPALPWMETNDFCAYTSANNVYSHSKRYLVSSKSNVVDKTQEWHLPRNVEHFLGLATKYPSVQEVLEQFLNFRTQYDTKNEYISDGQLEEICEELYKYIESACKENCLDIIIKELQSQPFFLVDRKFVVGTMIAEEGPDLPPYLLKASPFLKRFPYLRQHAAWKKTFDSKDYQGVLQSIYEKSNGQPLDNEGLEVAVLAADRLASFVSDDTNQQLDAFLPDEHNCMMPVSELCYCDVDWFKFDKFELLRCSKKISLMVARKLKVKGIRQQMLGSYDVTFPGEEFGQHEKLTTRITRILESYPSDETILKELLQNADDAGASEIHFVYDPRSHHGNRLLGDRMEAMQGPALCVFNNQSFTDEDIRGIQNLGEGSKTDNMGKIGRYGVGFNAVYQLTDCPSFISKGERLCMFDPLLKYVPGATPNKPGRQIKVDNSVRSSYPDVFPCYLEDKLAYGRKDFTVFRFPLRKEASQLSQNAWPADKIRKLLQDFERAAFESLLFLKNITKISVSEITSSGDIEGTRTICAEVSEIDKEKKGSFLHEVQKFVTATQIDGKFQPEPAEAIYQMKLKGKGREEEWVICQQVGSEDVAVENAMHKYKLLPVGAVAARLPGRKGEFQGKAFCFLPLPIETGLPVHVHGYFALDHESRRHLWEGSTTDEQTKWNFHIIQRVIAPAYVRLLLWIQEFFVTKYEWSGLISHERTGHTLKFLQKYHTYFPMVSDKGSYWKALADRVYDIVTSKALKVFPSVYREHDYRKDYFLKWKTPIESSSDSLESKVGYFNTLSNQMDDQYVPPSSFPMHREKQEMIKNLKETLIEITFPLLESPPWIMKRLRDACKQLGDETSRPQVLEVSPSNVISFLHGDNPLQRQLPITLSKSRIHDEERLKRLINYCKKVKQPSFKEHLHGLPLLLTGDDKLRRFSRDEQVFHSKFCDLFMPQSHRFLHNNFLYRLPVEADVFCELDVTAVSFLLRDCTPCLECGSHEIKPLLNHLPPEPPWFQRLWLLLESFCSETKKPLAVASDIRDKLGCWAILPVTQIQHCRSRPYQHQAIKQVAPISLSPTVIMEPTCGFWSIHAVLRSLNVYKVDESILHEDSYKLIQHLVAHKDEPTRALDVLIYWVDRDPQRFRNLKPEEHEAILENFRYCESSDVLSRLKILPCFKTIGDNFVSIRGYDKVLVLPSKIPEREQDNWVKTTHAVFLQYNSSLQHLYKKLGLANTTEIDVYAEYILPAFYLLSEDSRLEHLVRVKELLQLLPWGDKRSREECRKDAISRLGLLDLPFITSANGEIMTAADFFDPEIEIFSLMLSEDHFPPYRVQISLGLDFLREIGLKIHVTTDLFLSFAKQVHESHHNPSEMRKKSHALVSELNENCKLHTDSTFLQLVSEVDFLVSDKISKEMKSIHPPFMKAGTLTRYSGSTSFKHKQLVWSTNSILPQYASISGQCWSCKTVLDDKMGVAKEPELMSVIKHLRNICNRLQQMNEKKISFPNEFVTVLQAILTFLSSKCVGQSCVHEDPCERCCIIRDELKNVPIVFLELKDEHRLVKAEQVCRTMDENLEPFICQLPDKWVPFFKVFQMLGGTVRPSIGQYAFVLQSIYNRGQDAIIDPNVINMVDRATRGLYGELIKIDSPLDTAAFAPAQSLYLPSSMGTLKRSDHLLMNDADHYAKRLRRSNLPLVKVFPSHERIAREALSKLPAKMKPKAVSNEVREELRTGKECLLNGVEPCEFERRLQILQSGEFLNALCCIMRHNGKKVDEETKNRFKGQLSRLKITCMHQLHSVLQIDGEDVAGSETEVPSFISRDNELFVRHSDEENTMETLLSVAIHVNQVLGNVLEDRNYVSILLSQKSPRTISRVLEMFSIPGELSEEDTSFKLPDPGSTIPEQLYHLIEQDPWTSFHEGDYVAYAQTDEDGEYYIYAVMVKTIGSESLKSFHLIDVGRGNPIKANVLDIHKIHIPKSTIGMEVVLSDKVNSGEGEPFRAGHRESSLPSDIEEAKQQVTTELEEVWQLPEEQKRKAVHRMMLKWHPDKHPEGPKELFDEAFKHLQKEIQRLEKGLSRTTSWFEDLFKSANQRAREDRQRYTHFGGFSSGFWRGGGFSGGGFRSGTHYNTFHQFFSDVSRAPDIRNARRWLRQGQEDLRAAQHDLDPHDEPSLEWVAYKCHQSVEKALKASQLAIGGQYSFTHSIFSLANDVSDHFNKSSEFVKNVGKLRSLVDDQRARYPDRCASSEIPHEAFRDKAKAEEMIKLAHSILEEVQTFIH